MVAGPGWGSDPSEGLKLLFHVMGAIEDPPEEEMATHSSIFAWRIPWTEEPSGLHPKGCKESNTAEHAHTQRQKQLVMRRAI